MKGPIRKEIDLTIIQKKKKQIEEELKHKQEQSNIHVKFGQSHRDILEEEFKLQTVGLVTREEFKRKRDNIDTLYQEEQQEKEKVEQQIKLQEKKARLQKYKKQTKMLSFGEGEEDEANEQINQKPIKEIIIEEIQEAGSQATKKRNFGKNPNVDTTFLPDSERYQKEKEKKEQLVKQYYEIMEKEKNEILEMNYTYWDGSNQVLKKRIKKATKIGAFLENVRKELCFNIPELRQTSGENLHFVVKDKILPNHFSFLEVIKMNLKCKNQLVFDLEKKVETVKDQQIEYFVNKLSNPGKIIEKSQYEKSKHVFPCNEWQKVDPEAYGKEN